MWVQYDDCRASYPCMNVNHVNTIFNTAFPADQPDRPTYNGVLAADPLSFVAVYVGEGIKGHLLARLVTGEGEKKHAEVLYFRVMDDHREKDIAQRLLKKFCTTTDKNKEVSLSKALLKGSMLNHQKYFENLGFVAEKTEAKENGILMTRQPGAFQAYQGNWCF